MRKLLITIFSIFIILAVFVIIFNYYNIDKVLLQRLYPKNYLEYVENSSTKYNIDENMIFSIIKNESNFKNDISSHRGAKGLMQIMESTAVEVANKIGILEINLANPELNIEIGTKYYSDLCQKYGNEKLALAAYNAGTGTVDKWINSGILYSDGSNIEQIPYKETNMYVRKVIQTKSIYDYIYN